MAHFAELNESNQVIQVIVVHNNELLDENGVEKEEKGISFCKELYGQETNWVQTSYNANFRKNYAGIGMLYDPIADHFYREQPYASWLFNAETAKWVAPKPMPEGMFDLLWNEDKLDWEIPD